MKITQESLALLRECVDERTPVIFSADGWDIVYQTTIVAIQEQSVVLNNRVPAAHIAAVVGAKGFGLQCKMLRFQSPILESDGEHMVLSLANLEQLEETRQAERFPFQSDERVICEIKNPLDQKTVLVKSVLDMSATGISLRCPRPSKLMQKGAQFAELNVVIDGEVYQRVAATIVYTRQLMDLSGKLRVQVGMKFI